MVGNFVGWGATDCMINRYIVANRYNFWSYNLPHRICCFRQLSSFGQQHPEYSVSLIDGIGRSHNPGISKQEAPEEQGTL